MHLIVLLLRHVVYEFSVDYAKLLSTFEHYDGTNFPSWNKDVLAILKVLDLDYALREDKPTAPAVGTKNYDGKLREYNSNSVKWERSNDLAKMVIRHTINDALRGSFPTKKNGKELSVKEFMYSIEEMYKDELANFLFIQLTTSRYNDQGVLSEHIKSMVNIAEELKALGRPISSDQLARFITRSLPENYKKRTHEEEYAQVICSFCKSPNHMQRRCPRFIAWLQKGN